MTSGPTYWIAIPGSQEPPVGPLDLGRLLVGLREGSIPPNATTCAVGEASWVPVTEVVASSRPVTADATGPQDLVTAGTVADAGSTHLDASDAVVLDPIGAEHVPPESVDRREPPPRPGLPKTSVFARYPIGCPACGKRQLRPRSRTHDFRCQACGTAFPRTEIEEKAWTKRLSDGPPQYHTGSPDLRSVPANQFARRSGLPLAEEDLDEVRALQLLVAPVPPERMKAAVRAAHRIRASFFVDAPLVGRDPNGAERPFEELDFARQDAVWYEHWKQEIARVLALHQQLLQSCLQQQVPQTLAMALTDARLGAAGSRGTSQGLEACPPIVRKRLLSTGSPRERMLAQTYFRQQDEFARRAAQEAATRDRQERREVLTQAYLKAGAPTILATTMADAMLGAPTPPSISRGLEATAPEARARLAATLLNVVERAVAEKFFREQDELAEREAEQQRRRQPAGESSPEEQGCLMALISGVGSLLTTLAGVAFVWILAFLIFAVGAVLVGLLWRLLMGG